MTINFSADSVSEVYSDLCREARRCQVKLQESQDDDDRKECWRIEKCMKLIEELADLLGEKL